MFKTQEQIDEVSKRTKVPPKYVKELGIMMSRVKLAQEGIIDLNSPFADISIKEAKQNLNKALFYFEKNFLQCNLW